MSKLLDMIMNQTLTSPLCVTGMKVQGINRHIRSFCLQVSIVNIVLDTQ